MKNALLKRKRFNIQAALFAMASLVFLTGVRLRAGETVLPATQVIPRETAVLLLPALDATKDAKNMLAPRQMVIRHRDEYEFITRQFKMLGETMAAKAAKKEPRIELGDLSARTATNMDLLAKRAGADWVVSIVVEKAELDSTAEGEFKAHTRVMLQVWDARRHGWLANSNYAGEASGGGSPVFVFKDSLDHAVKDSLAKVLNAYPSVVPVLQEDSLKDYLAGQTRPFVGDPKKPFSGLNAEQ